MSHPHSHTPTYYLPPLSVSHITTLPFRYSPTILTCSHELLILPSPLPHSHTPTLFFTHLPLFSHSHTLTHTFPSYFPISITSRNFNPTFPHTHPSHSPLLTLPHSSRAVLRRHHIAGLLRHGAVSGDAQHPPSGYAGPRGAGPGEARRLLLPRQDHVHPPRRAGPHGRPGTPLPPARCCDGWGGDHDYDGCWSWGGGKGEC